MARSDAAEQDWGGSEAPSKMITEQTELDRLKALERVESEPDKFPFEPQPWNFRWGLWAALSVGILLFIWGTQAAFLTVYFDVPQEHMAVITAPDGSQIVSKESGSVNRRNKVTIVDLRVNVVKVTKTVPSKDNNAWNVELTVPYTISRERGGVEANVKTFVKVFGDRHRFETFYLRPNVEKTILSVMKVSRDEELTEKRTEMTKRFTEMLETNNVVTLSPITYNVAKLHASDKSSDSQILIVPPGSNVNINTGQVRQRVRQRVREKPRIARQHRVTTRKIQVSPYRRAPRRSRMDVWTCGPFGLEC